MPDSHSVSESFAAWAVEQRDRPLPPDVSRQTRLVTLDLLGVALGGLEISAARVIREVVVEMGGRADATVLGSGTRLPAPQAALANGTAGHALDMDDGHRMAAGHPGTTVIPAALATAELTEASGAAYLSAVAVGYEVFVRLAAAMNPAHLQRGFHTTGTVGALGAAVASGLLLGLDAPRLAHALGAAAHGAAGLLEVVHGGAMLKPVQAGRAAQGGALAALYAARGGEAPARALEGKDGFLRALANPEAVPELPLGPPSAILGGYIKLYAACRHVHPAVDAVFDLLGRAGPPPDRVAQVVVRTYEVADRLTGRQVGPSDVGASRFSLPFAVALAAVRGSVGPEQFTTSALQDPALQAFAQKVVVRVDPAFTDRYPGERGAEVTLALADGGRRTSRVIHPRGEPENPLPPEGWTEKFLTNARSALGEGRAREVVALVDRLPEIGVRDLTAALRP